MFEFRNRKCSECAWMRKITYSDYYGGRTEMNCTNAACRLEGTKLGKDSRACPAFVPLVTEASLANTETTDDER